jgi:hypothetical protein
VKAHDLLVDAEVPTEHREKLGKPEWPDAVSLHLTKKRMLWLARMLLSLHEQTDDSEDGHITLYGRMSRRRDA